MLKTYQSSVATVAQSTTSIIQLPPHKLAWDAFFNLINRPAPQRHLPMKTVIRGIGSHNLRLNIQDCTKLQKLFVDPSYCHVVNVYEEFLLVEFPMSHRDVSDVLQSPSHIAVHVSSFLSDSIAISTLNQICS